VPNIRPEPNLRCFLAAQYSVSDEGENSCFGRRLLWIEAKERLGNFPRVIRGRLHVRLVLLLQL
jgi:hypothetical protein